jgi:hypothetical protein
MLAETFIAELAVEVLHEAVLLRRAGRNLVPFDAVRRGLAQLTWIFRLSFLGVAAHRAVSGKGACMVDGIGLSRRGCCPRLRQALDCLRPLKVHPEWIR